MFNFNQNYIKFLCIIRRKIATKILCSCSLSQTLRFTLGFHPLYSRLPWDNFREADSLSPSSLSSPLTRPLPSNFSVKTLQIMFQFQFKIRVMIAFYIFCTVSPARFSDTFIRQAIICSLCLDVWKWTQICLNSPDPVGCPGPAYRPVESSPVH